MSWPSTDFEVEIQQRLDEQDETIATLTAALAARDEEVRRLTVELAEIERHALERAADLCEREARACRRHAAAFREMRAKDRVPLARAHEMAGHQSDACAHYIRALSAHAPADGEKGGG